MVRGLRAWVDESIHVQGPAPGFYVVAATVGDPAEADSLRSGLRGLVAGPTQRLHWKTETVATRRRVAAFIAATDLVHLVVVSEAVASKQERARRKCMERLLFELDQLGVVRVWIEARQAAQDRRDQKMLDAMLGAGSLSSAFRAGFAWPLDEPMLWIPDAVAGMAGADRRTGGSAWLSYLGEACEVIDR